MAPGGLSGKHSGPAREHVAHRRERAARRRLSTHLVDRRRCRAGARHGEVPEGSRGRFHQGVRPALARVVFRASRGGKEARHTFGWPRAHCGNCRGGFRRRAAELGAQLRCALGLFHQGSRGDAEGAGLVRPRQGGDARTPASRRRESVHQLVQRGEMQSPLCEIRQERHVRRPIHAQGTRRRSTGNRSAGRQVFLAGLERVLVSGVEDAKTTGSSDR